MKKILKIMLVSVLALAALTGCGKKIEPFAESPDIYVDIPHMKDFVNMDNNKLIERYQFGYIKNIYNGDSTDLDTFEPEMKKTFSEDEFARWQNVTDDFNWFVSNIAGDFNDDIIKVFQITALEYLRYTRMNEDNETILSEDMEALKVREKTQEYMKENKIVVEDIIMAETPEFYLDRVYPFMLQFDYTVIGTVDGEPFEKDFKSMFYMSVNRDKYAVMEYVREGLTEDSK